MPSPPRFISIAVPPEIDNLIKEVAHIEGRKKYAVIGRAIEFYRQHSEGETVAALK